MNVDRAVVTFCKYSAQEKTEFLLLLAHALTVLARETYEPGGDGLTEPSRLRRIAASPHQ